MDNTEFSQRVMPHSRKMFAVAYRFLQRPEEAEDVLQDVMMKLWQMRDKLPPDKEMLPFLLTVVKNLCLDRLRQRQTKEENLELSNIEDVRQNSSQHPLDIDDEVEEKDRLRFLVGLIDQLPPDQQKVLRLKAFDELTTEEIAKQMSIQPENVRQLLSRARKKLRELAQKQGLI